ncbi:hypothetical protein Tco_0763859 [Tanacetum coccineum]
MLGLCVAYGLDMIPLDMTTCHGMNHSEPFLADLETSQTLDTVGLLPSLKLSIGIDIPVCLGLTLVKQTQFHLSQLRMSWVEHLHGLTYDGVLYYGIYGVCIGILACRGLSLVSSPLHAMKSQSQIQSSAAVKFGGVTDWYQSSWL